MVGALVPGEINRAPQTATFAVMSSVDHVTDPGLHKSSCTHRTGFQRHDQCALIEPPVTEDQRCLAKSHQFRMTKWI